jgi:PAS domain S-box-containing protein
MKSPIEILHLEDDANDAELILERLLEAAIPCNVTLARNRSDFLAALERRGWNLILSDYSLPDIDGLAALKYAVEEAPGTAFIFVTGAMGEDLAVETLKRGATDYILKHRLERLGPCVRRALRETEERDKRGRAELNYRRLFETARDGVLLLDGETGTIVDANPAVESILGYGRDEMLGKKAWEASPFRNVSECQDAFRTLQEKEYVHYGDVPLQAQSGARIDVELTGIAFQADKKMVRLTVRDITERKQFQNMVQKNVELQSANVAKDRFLASMSHELRTPLNAIIGFTGTLLMKLPGPLTEEQTKQLQTIRSSAKHLLSLINDLLDLARIESGKIDLNIEPVVLQGVLAEVRSTLVPLAEKKGLELKVTAPQPEVVLRTDRRALSQILLNLTSNAIKFTEKGEVRIVLNRESADGKLWIQLTVQDTGIGIPPDDQSQLFQAFTQVDRNVRRRKEGSGLGLYLSYKLAESLGGQITFKSECGKGSTFTLFLPET